MEENLSITEEDVLEIQYEIEVLLKALPMYDVEIDRYLKKEEPVIEEEKYTLKHYMKCIEFREFLIERVVDVFRGYPN